MKTKVNRLSSINVDLFYNVSISRDCISLQGDVSSELIKYCMDELLIEFKPNDKGWLIGKCENELGNLRVTLT